MLKMVSPQNEADTSKVRGHTLHHLAKTSGWFSSYIFNQTKLPYAMYRFSVLFFFLAPLWDDVLKFAFPKKGWCRSDGLQVGRKGKQCQFPKTRHEWKKKKQSKYNIEKTINQKTENSKYVSRMWNLLYT